MGSGDKDATVLEELVREGGESAGSERSGWNVGGGMSGNGRREDDATGCVGVVMLSGESRLRGLYGNDASCTERYGG